MKMKKLLLLTLFTYMLQAEVLPKNILAKSCLNSYLHAYKSKKDHKAFVYAREKETDKDRCNWSYGYASTEEAIDSAMKGCQSVLLNAECMLVDTDANFTVEDGLFSTLKPVDNTPLSTNEIDILMKEAKSIIRGNCLPFFEKYLNINEHKSFGYSVDVDGKYACGYSYSNQTEKISKKQAIKSCEDNKRKRGTKAPKSSCKVYATNKQVLLHANDYGIDLASKTDNKLTQDEYDVLLLKAKTLIKDWPCLIQFKYYLKSGQHNAYYLAKSNDGKEVCGRSEDAFTLDVAKQKAQKSCETRAKEQHIKNECKLIAKDFDFVGKTQDYVVQKTPMAEPKKVSSPVVKEKSPKKVEKVVHKQNKIDMSKPLPLPETLKITADTLNKTLPSMVDEELRLDKVTAKDRKMTFHYTLVNFTNVSMPSNKLKSLMYDDMKNQVCADKDTIMLLKQGMTLDYNYNGKDKKLITVFAFDAKTCGVLTNVEQIKKNILNMIKKK